jgi:hypothetical protein
MLTLNTRQNRNLILSVFFFTLAIILVFAWRALAGDAALSVAAAPPFDWAAFLLGALPILIPAVIAIMKLTVWGRQNAAALDETEQALGHVVGAVGAARRGGQPAAAVLQIMSGKEKFTPREVISRWKEAVKMFDPKGPQAPK